jgi:hypothetical protein
MTTTEETAAQFFGTLWAAFTHAGGTKPPIPTHQHYPHAYDPAWLATLPLPTDDPDQPVDLAEGGHFEHHQHPAALARAYRENPRTRVHVGLHRASPWITRAADHLTRLTGSAPHVMATAYASTTGDATIGAHDDAWDGAIIQITGAKTWHLGPGLLHSDQPTHQVTTTPGDILILPDGTPHAVTTPREPGYSLHLAFAIRRRRPDAPTLARFALAAAL